MDTKRRSSRLFWFVGLVLLVGSIAGARYMMNGTANPTKARNGQNNGAPQNGKDPDRFVTALGYVDVEDGLIPLYPVQIGRVTAVYVREGDPVIEGQLLLSVDNRFALLKRQEAQADLTAAREQLAKVARLPKRHAQKVAQQEMAIEVARFNARAHRFKLTLAERIHKEAKQLSAEEVDALREAQRGLDLLAKLEEAKLKELKEVSFAEDIKRAKMDVEAKEAQLLQADLGVRECDLYAPRDGMILRLQVNAGEVLSKDPRLPILQLCPDERRIVRAEVLQEWANHVKKNALAQIEDDAGVGKPWTGRVLSVSGWFTQRRHRLLEPFQYNDVRTLECLVEVTGPENAPQLRIGQRMRVKIFFKPGDR